VTDSSYPAVNSIYAQQAARLQQQTAASSANASKIVGGDALNSNPN
jgi:hypothetical protein